jgi:hypothetical protein
MSSFTNYAGLDVQHAFFVKESGILRLYFVGELSQFTLMVSGTVPLPAKAGFVMKVPANSSDSMG